MRIEGQNDEMNREGRVGIKGDRGIERGRRRREKEVISENVLFTDSRKKKLLPGFCC